MDQTRLGSLIEAVMNTTIGFCILAATVYGFGKTFLWPTMLGVVSERFPKGGALTLGAAAMKHSKGASESAPLRH